MPLSLHLAAMLKPGVAPDRTVNEPGMSMRSDFDASLVVDSDS